MCLGKGMAPGSSSAVDVSLGCCLAGACLVVLVECVWHQNTRGA